LQTKQEKFRQQREDKKRQEEETINLLVWVFTLVLLVIILYYSKCLYCILLWCNFYNKQRTLCSVNINLNS